MIANQYDIMNEGKKEENNAPRPRTNLHIQSKSFFDLMSKKS